MMLSFCPRINRAYSEFALINLQKNTWMVLENVCGSPEEPQTTAACAELFSCFFFSPFNPLHLDQHHLLLLRLAEGSSHPVVPSLPHCHILWCDYFFWGLCNIFFSSDVAAGFPLSQELHGEFQSAPPPKEELLVISVWRHTHLQPKRVIVLQLKLLLPQTWDRTIINFSRLEYLWCSFLFPGSSFLFHLWFKRWVFSHSERIQLYDSCSYFTLPVQHGLFTDTQPSGIMTWIEHEPWFSGCVTYGK